MRYVVAMFVACAIIGTAAYFVHSTRLQLQRASRTALVKAKEKGEITDEQLDDVLADKGGFGMELQPREMCRVQIAEIISAFWLVLAPLTLALCLLVAHLSIPNPKQVKIIGAEQGDAAGAAS